MNNNKNAKPRFGVATKLSLGFFCILLMLIFITYQSLNNYRDTSKTLSSLITISEGILTKTNKVQTTLLTAVADFKRISEKDTNSEIENILSQSQSQHKEIQETLHSISQMNESNMSFINDVDALSNNVDQMWRLIDLSTKNRLQQLLIESDIEALNEQISHIETTITPYFENLFWDANDDQTLLVLNEFYSSFLSGLNVIKDFQKVTTIEDLQLTTAKYKEWQALHLDYFLEMTSLIIDYPDFKEANKYLTGLTENLDNIILGTENEDQGLVNLYSQDIQLKTTAKENLNQIENVISNTLASVETLNKEANSYAGNLTNNMQSNILSGINILLFTAVIAILASVIISILLLRTIRNPLKEVIEALSLLSKGDLRFIFKQHNNDEFGDLSMAAEKVNTQLKSMVGNIHSKSQSLNELTSSTEKRTDQALLQVEKQANELTSVAASMQEMTYTVTEVSNSASLATEEVVTIITLSEKADSGMNNSQRSISQLRGHLNSAVSVTGEMTEAVSRIEQILTVIRSIAEQTNLLALNAAIEAARAGEHGRGFAVVADEVRGLANRTQLSTGEIHTIISELNEAVDKTVHVIEESAEMANESDQEFITLANIFTELNTSIEKLSASSEHISHISLDQSKTAEEINQQVNAISMAANDTRNEVNDVTKNISLITNVSDDLDEMISLFKITK
ncbi:methyl-accepting chemotaxis protein [Psychromonas sp. PT13]|uniref:methyl-accepting chemotaxis protein n=1 Tax=Psychromonas sp. PT13 TaxID=3439547 RepID=UPI003EBE5AE3